LSSNRRLCLVNSEQQAMDIRDGGCSTVALSE
jgi:hypothetical protein